MSSIGKSSLFTFLTQIPTQLFGIIAGIFITRILGPEGRGVYAIFLADIGLFSTIMSFSINMVIIQFKATGRIDEGKLIGISVIFSIIAVLLSIVTLLVWVNSPIANSFLPEKYLTLEFYLIFIFYFILTQITTVYSSLFQGARRFDIVNRVSIYNSVLNLTAYGIVFLLDSYGIVKIDLFHILIVGACLILLNNIMWHLYFSQLNTKTANFKVSWREDIQPFFKFMMQGHLSNIINFLNYRLILWIIAIYLNSVELGLFALATSLAQLLNFISMPLSQVLMPFLSSKSGMDRDILFLSFSRVHFATIIVTSILAILVGPYLIPILYGNEFTASGAPFTILIFGMILSGHSRILASYFIAIDKLYLNLIATIIGFCVTFIFNFILVKNYGIMGAAWAQFATYTAIFLSVYLFLIFKTELRGSNLFLPMKEDISRILRMNK